MVANGGLQLVEDPSQAKPEGWTRFVCFSDTHGLHGKIPAEHIVHGDVLIHAGDFSDTGQLEQILSFSEWLKAYPCTHKVVIAGNHDITFHEEYYHRAWRRFHRDQYDCREARASLTNCIYLEDSGAEVAGYKIYGSPWQPEFCDWAFNLQPEERCGTWEKIPDQVDILLAHGPAYGHGDAVVHGGRVGCQHLLQAIQERRVPVFVCGHIHEGYGTTWDGQTALINASTCTFQYKPTNPPIVFDAPPAAQLRDHVALAPCDVQADRHGTSDAKGTELDAMSSDGLMV